MLTSDTPSPLNESSLRLLTVRDVAWLLHVHVNTVRLWADRGTLPCYRLGTRRDRRFRREDVERSQTRLVELLQGQGAPTRAPCP